MHNKYGFAPATPEGGQLYVNTPSDIPAAINKRIADYEEKFKRETKYVPYEYAKHGTLRTRFTPNPSAGQVYKLVEVYERRWQITQTSTITITSMTESYSLLQTANLREPHSKSWISQSSYPPLVQWTKQPIRKGRTPSCALCNRRLGALR